MPKKRNQRKNTPTSKSSRSANTSTTGTRINTAVRKQRARYAEGYSSAKKAASGAQRQYRNEKDEKGRLLRSKTITHTYTRDGKRITATERYVKSANDDPIIKNPFSQAVKFSTQDKGKQKSAGQHNANVYQDMQSSWNQETQDATGFPFNERYAELLPSAKGEPNTVRDQMARLTASMAEDIQANHPHWSQSDIRQTAITQARQAALVNRPGIDLSRSSPAEIRSVAFATTPRTMTSSEADEYRRKKATKGLNKTSATVPAPGYADRGLNIDAGVAEGRASGKLKLKPGANPDKTKLTTKQFITKSSPEEQKWIDQQFNDPKGLFWGAQGNRVPGAYRKWQRYMNAREAGYGDRDNITDWLKSDMRGRTKTTDPDRPQRKESEKIIKAQYTKGIVKPVGKKSSERYKSNAPSHEDFGVGIRVPGMPSQARLKAMYPNASDTDIFQLKESNRQLVAEDFLQNQKMGYEQRQAIVTNKKPGDVNAQQTDRVVFFTTSAGWPATSVPAQSLVGQYIIKKRKKMVLDNKGATRAQLKGEFPPAVRDQHLVEVASGLSVGAQGRYGAFRHVGYRAGSHKSKGYGKILPVGSQILTDTNGQPLYDRNGNLRYTEGFTRPFDVRPSNEVGLRIYLG